MSHRIGRIAIGDRIGPIDARLVIDETRGAILPNEHPIGHRTRLNLIPSRTPWTTLSLWRSPDHGSQAATIALVRPDDQLLLFIFEQF